MKRKYQHEDCPSHEKEFKLSDYKKATKKFDDLCEDVIEVVLSKLELVDLVNISDTNIHLQNIARSIFHRKYGNHLICIEALEHAYPTDNAWYRKCKIKQFIRISDAKVWFKLIRNFGESIKYVLIKSYYGTFWDDGNIPIFYKHLIEYILKYCSDSLELLELQDYPFLPLNTPLKKLNEFIGITAVSFEEIKYMPNLRTLRLQIIPKTLENQFFPNLIEFTAILDSSEDVYSFISAIHMNRQIKKLFLFLDSDGYNDIIFSSINEHLPELKALKICTNYKLRNDVPAIIPNYRFKNIDSLSFIGPCNSYKSFMFIDVKKLSLSYLNRGDITGINLALSMKQLRILRFEFGADCIKHHQILLTEFSELELIIVRVSSSNECMILNQMLATQWKQIQMEKRFTVKTISYFKLRFQRIR